MEAIHSKIEYFMRKKIRKQDLLITIVFFILLLGNCRDKSPADSSGFNLDFRREMRSFVQKISEHARKTKPDFIVIQQNAQDLIAETKNDSLIPFERYMTSIDAISREGLFYGYLGDDAPTPVNVKNEIIPYLKLAQHYGLQILVTDYCSTESRIDSSYQKNSELGFISFAASHRELDNLPDYPEIIFNDNNAAVTDLKMAKNYLYLINPHNFSSLEEMLAQIEKTNYDVIIIDAFYHDNFLLRKQDVQRLQKKPGGASRLVISYMSIGEAENYRFYWKAMWNQNPPPWILKENPDWPGNYLVLYWEKEWQDIIIYNDDSYLNRILRAGFDGVFLDIVDAYEYFENWH